MSSFALPAWLVTLLDRWTRRGPDVRVLDAVWDWQPKYPAMALIVALVLLWALALLVHRSKRVELSWPWRVGLGLLRTAALSVPIFMLLQPSLSIRFERIRPKMLAFVVDRSASMSVRDRVQPTQSRWESAVNAVLQATQPLRQATATVSPAVPATQPVQTQLWLFDDEKAELTRWNDFKAETPPRPERQTAIGTAMQSIRTSLAGEPNAAVILVSDGADNASFGENAPLTVAREFGRDNIVVHTVLVGNEHPRDLAVGVTAEAPFAFTGDPVPLQVRVEHAGFDAMPIGITVRDGDRELAAKELVLPADGQPASERIEVTFSSPGLKHCRVSVSPLPGELTPANNIADTDVLVLDQKIRVLYVEHWPRWQYRFLRNAFQRDVRFETRLVLLTDDPSAPQEERQGAAMPTKAEDFSKFDTFIIGEVARQDLSPQQWQWIHDCVVNEGAGVIFIAGPGHNPADFAEPPMALLLPFERVTTVSEEEVTPFKPMLTPLGLHHPLMRLGTSDPSRASGSSDDPAERWRQLPNLQWYAGVKDLKPGAIVLAERQPPAGGDATPLIVLQRAGRGSSLFVGTDETWKWRYQVGNQYFYGFWGRAIQHVGMPHRVGEFRNVRVETAARTSARNMPVPVSVAFESPAGVRGNEDSIKLIAERKEGGLPPTSFVLRRSADSPFVFQGEVRLASEGTYRLYAEGHDKQGETTIEVKSTGQFNPELASPAVDAALLRRIAEVSGGKNARVDELPVLLSSLDLSPLRFRWTERVVLWDGWTLLTILAVLLTVEWVLRKLRYLP